MSEIERRYRAEIASWSGRRRVERSAELLEEVWEMLARQVLVEHPGLPPREVRRRVAARMYRSDPETLRLISRLDS